MSSDVTFAIAYKFFTLGYCVLPSGGGRSGKSPLIPWKVYQTTKPTDEQLERWQAKLNPRLWGFVTGRISNTFVVDDDKPEHNSIMSNSGLRPHRKTPRGGLHYDCLWPGFDIPTKARILPNIDVRGEGGFVNFIGRVGDKSYDLLQLPCTETLISFSQLPPELQKVLCARATATQSTATPATRIILEGQRNDTLTRLAGSLRYRGLSSEAIYAALRVTNQEQCHPPLSNDELRRICESVGRYAPAQTLARQSGESSDRRIGMVPLSAWRQRVLSDPPSDDLINDLLPNCPSEYVLLCGRAGIGKTNLVLDMAFCLATGTPWFGYKTKKCQVGYLGFEGSPKKLLARFEKLGKSYPDPRENLFVNRGLPFKLSGVGVDQLRSNIEGLDVVIIDPLRYVAPGDYTKPDAASAFIGTLKGICNETHTVPILVHHVRKPDRRLAVRPEDLQFEVKGGTEYVDAAGTVLLMERARQARKADGRFGSNADDRLLHFVKVKDSASEALPLNLRFNRDTLRYEPIAVGDEDDGECH